MGVGVGCAVPVVYIAGMEDMDFLRIVDEYK